MRFSDINVSCNNFTNSSKVNQDKAKLQTLMLDVIIANGSIVLTFFFIQSSDKYWLSQKAMSFGITTNHGNREISACSVSPRNCERKSISDISTPEI